jgi:hypothetical protein
MGLISQAMQTATASYEQFNQNIQRLMEMGGQGMQQAAPQRAPAPAPASKRGR